MPAPPPESDPAIVKAGGQPVVGESNGLDIPRYSSPPKRTEVTETPVALIPELGTEKAGFKNTEHRQPIPGDGAEFALVSVPSLRWYNPDQVRRVSGHVIHNLSAFSRTPGIRLRVSLTSATARCPGTSIELGPNSSRWASRFEMPTMVKTALIVARDSFGLRHADTQTFGHSRAILAVALR